MSGETTTTSVTELIYGEWISPYIQDYAGQYKNPSQFASRWDPQNGSSTVSIPRWVSGQGTPNDDGAAVDTEYNATEASDIAATELETTDSTFSIAEYGIRRDPTDTAIEDAISAAALLSHIATDATSNLMAAANDDMCALFASFSNSSGSTGVDFSIANFDDALYSLADRGVVGSLVAILDNQAARDFLTALQAVGTSMAQFAQSADRQMATSFDKDQGRNAEGRVGEYKGVELFRQGMTDTANTGADVVSAIFVRGDQEANRSMSAIGQGSRRDFRIETQRDASKRTTEVITTMRWGCGIAQNGSGQKEVTDA
jgi:hypothetical protein